MTRVVMPALLGVRSPLSRADARREQACAAMAVLAFGELSPQ